MKAMIVATGSEILKGEVVNTNAAWIGSQLSTAGIDVLSHVGVGDDLESIRRALGDCVGACDMVVVTGGLGPTKDDLTAEAAAEMAEVFLKEDARARASVEAYFKNRGRDVPSTNHKQALLPEGAVCIENPVGTAPGFSMVKGQTEFFFLPGVPFEMRSLMRDAVLPKVSGDHHLFKHLTTFGLAESAVGERLFDLERLYPGVHLGYRANFPVIEVKIWAFAPPESALENAWKKASLEAEVRLDRKSTRLNSSHRPKSRMPSSA